MPMPPSFKPLAICRAVRPSRAAAARSSRSARAAARGVSVSDYMAGNLLQQEVRAEDVAEAFVYLAKAARTTAAVVTVDGGLSAQWEHTIAVTSDGCEILTDRDF